MSFPDVPVVMAHMGHGNAVYINAAIDIAERRPNVYLETSGMPMHTKIAEAVERVGTERVMYGSDAPFHHPAVEILRVQVSGLNAGELEDVLHRSGRRLFFRDDVAAEGGGDEPGSDGMIAMATQSPFETNNKGGTMGRRSRVASLTGFALVAAVSLVVVAGGAASTQKVDGSGVCVPPRSRPTTGGTSRASREPRRRLRATGAKVIDATGSGYDNVEPNLRRLAQQGADLIIAHASGYNSAAPAVAAGVQRARRRLGRQGQRGQEGPRLERPDAGPSRARTWPGCSRR